MSLAFQDPPMRNRDELVVRGDLTAEVRDQLAPEIRRLEQLLRALVPDEPKAPVVNVAPPNVTVKAENPPAEVEVNLSGMEQLATSIGGLRTDLAAFTTMLMRPTVREVKRDGNGRITQIIDRRT